MSTAPIDSAFALDLYRSFWDALAPGQVLEALFESVPGVFFFVKDRESRFMAGSQSFAESLGADSIERMIGRTDYDYSPDFLSDAFYEDDQRVITTGKAVRNKIELVPAADGSLDWLCTTKIPLFDTRGAVVGLAGVARIIQDTDAVYADHPEMQEIVSHVRSHYREKLSVADMARIGGISVSTQERLFRKTFGLTPSMYLRKTRLNAACKLLRESETSLASIAVQSGFNDQTNMTRAFRLELKITPLRYRRRFSDVQRPRASFRSVRHSA